MDPRHQRGQEGENLAWEALETRNYILIKRNYRCKYGEIDIIAEEGETLCFIEVRSRRAGALVGGGESVDWRKRRRLARAAQHYCLTQKVGERAMRFDVVSIRMRDTGEHDIELIRNAFDAEGAL